MVFHLYVYGKGLISGTSYRPLIMHSTASIPMPGSRKLKSADLRTSPTYCARVLQQKLEQSRETKEDDSWGDEEELVVRALPSKYRSANVGHFAQLLLKEVGWYFILPYTLNQPFDLHQRTGGVGFFSHNNLSNHPPIQPLYYHK